MLSDSGESSPLGTTGRDVCCHRQRHTSQSHRPRHHRHCGREESWHLFLWSETCRYGVQPRAKNILPTCCICVFMFDAHIIDTSRSNCGAADRDGSACRQDSGLPGPRTGQFLTPSVWSGQLKKMLYRLSPLKQEGAALIILDSGVCQSYPWCVCVFVLFSERGDHLLSCWAAYREERWDSQCQQTRHGVSNSIRYRGTEKTHWSRSCMQSTDSNVMLCQCLLLICSISTEGKLAYEARDRLFVSFGWHVC